MRPSVTCSRSIPRLSSSLHCGAWSHRQAPPMGAFMAWDDMATPFVRVKIGLDPETVIYRPKNGRPRKIDAVVIRNPPAAVPELFGKMVAAVWHLTVMNDETQGIASKEINTGGDSVDVIERVGKAPEAKEITRILSHDDGMMTLEVR